MAFTRREILHRLSIGLGIVGSGFPAIGKTISTLNEPSLKGSAGREHFNMSGYRAPKIENVRIGIIGLGNRGTEAVRRMAYIDGVSIVALGDKYANKVDASQELLIASGFPKATGYSGSEDAWRSMMDRKDIDLIYICTPWHLHAPMALAAMRSDKHAAVEVPVATNMDECWELVETSEKTKKHCMMLENCCYDFFEMLTLNMARNGMFGEIVHAEGAYIHDLVDLNFSDTYYADYWRLKENAHRNGSLYPTHGIGPIAQCLDINRGDKMDFLVSVSTADFSMHDRAVAEAKKNPNLTPYTNVSFRGNMNTTTIRTAKGKSMIIQHDVSSPRPYSRIHLVSGTKGIAQKYPGPKRIAFGHSWVKPEAMTSLFDEHTPPIIRHIGKMAKEVGGHGGMDFIMDWRLIDCLRNGLPLDQDVYDAASWSAVGLLSEYSVARRSASIDIPDFTKGSWKTNKPVDLELKEGATTGVRVKK